MATAKFTPLNLRINVYSLFSALRMMLLHLQPEKKPTAWKCNWIFFAQRDQGKRHDTLPARHFQRDKVTSFVMWFYFAKIQPMANRKKMAEKTCNDKASPVSCAASSSRALLRRLQCSGERRILPRKNYVLIAGLWFQDKLDPFNNKKNRAMTMQPPCDTN